MSDTNDTEVPLSSDQMVFLDEIVTLLAQWNIPANAARVYGYLLMCNEPASLDEISDDLTISKSNASGAAKMLEQWGHARRTRNHTTKRIYYEINDDYGVPFSNRLRMLEEESVLLRNYKNRVATGRAAERLEELASYCEDMSQALERVNQHYKERATR